MVAGTIPLVLISIPDLRRQDWANVPPLAWGALLYSAVFAVTVGYTIWYASVQRVGNARTAIYSNLTPVVAILFAWLTLGDALAPLQLLGGAIVLAGLIVTRKRAHPLGCREASLMTARLYEAGLSVANAPAGRYQDGRPGTQPRRFLAAAIILIQWLLRGRPPLPAWHWLALALILLAGLGLIVLTAAGRPAPVMSSSPRNPPCPRRPPGRWSRRTKKLSSQQVASRCRSSARYLANLLAYWRSFGTREHCRDGHPARVAVPAREHSRGSHRHVVHLPPAGGHR